MLLLLSLNLSANFVVNNGKVEYYTSEYYTEACENGDRNRCVDLGILYITGDGVQENHKKAEELFTIACKKKHSKACYHLGSIYKRGSNGIKKIDSKAWYHLESKHKRGSNDIKKNLKKSKMFYALGCMYGYAQSCDQYNLIKEKAGAKSSDIDTNSYRYYTDEIW
jgi:TPR repeat protein